ncbi:MAG TPA: hypothetical protein VIH51_00400, partial [Myxococcales bacterium]
MTLAEALEPLYRSYLRRLDEMVARLPDGAALTERTTPAVDGRLALGGDGLPLRFDVADARDGHTYEVHGARPDAPLAGEVLVGGLRVRLDPGNWEELPVVCAFEREPSPDEVEALADLLRGFALVAWYGGFSGAQRADRWTGRAHGVRIELRRDELWAVLDLGTCPPAAMEALC